MPAEVKIILVDASRHIRGIIGVLLASLGNISMESTSLSPTTNNNRCHIPWGIFSILSALVLLLMLTGCASHQANTSETSSAYSELGMSYLAKGNEARAYQAFQHALKLDGDNASAMHGLALIEQAKGDPVRAEEYYLLTLRTLSKSGENPDNRSISTPQVRNNYAALLFEEGKFEQACQQLSQAASDNHYPGRVGILINLSQCQLKIGNMSKAQGSLDEAARIAPQQPLVLLAQAYMDLNEGKLDASRAELSHYEHLFGRTHDSQVLEEALKRENAIADEPAARN